tara:strand:+ start:894 stop:1160 length:267 start_codon:yes stop_codon:yes gene_type:complete
MTMRNVFVSHDGTEIEYYHNNDNTLSYKIEGTDWQDFHPSDKRAYSTQEYNEFIHILNNNNVTGCFNTGVELENVTDEWYDNNGQLKH